MKLVFKNNDIVSEIKDLIARAKTNKDVECISVSRQELSKLLSSPEASRLFPRFHETKTQRLEIVGKKLEAAKLRIEDPLVSDQDKFVIFDRIDELEREENELKLFVPKKLQEDGFIVRVSMN